MPADYLPSADWPRLALRAILLRLVRQFFDERGFLEVETPLLSADTVVDRHIDPLSVVLFDDARRPDVGRRMWLQTSPEFHMKRLLAAGSPAIYQVTRSFRGGEVGPLHNPEFTMVEWYRPGDSMAEGVSLLSDLCETLLARGPAERLTYREAFEKHAGINPHAMDAAQLRLAAVASGVVAPVSLGDDRDGWLDLLMSQIVGPRLGREQPAIVCDFPASQAALAVVRDENPLVAERFELFVDGIELANGYHELTDPAVLRERIAVANEQRQSDGKPPLPPDSRLLQAMDAGLPPCSGCALGFDRVVTLAAGATSIGDVMAFPIDRA
ncbi:MAG: EF-P lysine aminoacylase GenX [Planctomycetia bacterium]|nr:EF-P lysine aminoacylase GenX [Planctomycetia bacterium]